MNDDQKTVSLPNRLVHEPARLAILTVLSSCASADFVFLQNVTGLSKGNLSVQLTNLEEAGLIVIKKEIVERKMRTSVSFTKGGASEIEESSSPRLVRFDTHQGQPVLDESLSAGSLGWLSAISSRGY